MISMIVSSHTNTSLSGIAKFNSILADKLGITSLSFDNATQLLKPHQELLLSVRISDLTEQDKHSLSMFLKKCTEMQVNIDLFFHAFDGLQLEYDLISLSRKVYCGNREIAHALSGTDKQCVIAWCPHLLSIDGTIHDSGLNILTFGMAHKLQIKHYKTLNDLLVSSGIDFTLWVSTAFHEKAKFGDFNAISLELKRVFGDKINFLGFLSDDAINYFLKKIDLFTAFFSKGVRSNNTSIYVPMEKSIPVLTNLDEYSPEWMQHGKNIIDINQLTSSTLEREVLKKIGSQAKADVKQNAGWDTLVELFRLQ